MVAADSRPAVAAADNRLPAAVGSRHPQAVGCHPAEEAADSHPGAGNRQEAAGADIRRAEVVDRS